MVLLVSVYSFHFICQDGHFNLIKSFVEVSEDKDNAIMIL